jgi:hypothetical protein
MEIIDIIAIIIFVVLLISSLVMLIQFYICDNHNCKAFNCASIKGKKGSKEYTIALLEELCADGIWPLPYIGGTIITTLALWFIESPITTRNFAILFFVSFAISYFIISFLIHHYIEIILDYTIEYIENDCVISAN